MKFTKIITACLVFCIYASSANATLIGDTIDWQYYAYGGTYNGLGSPGSFVGGSTTDAFESYFNISANATQIIFDYSIASGSSTWSNSVNSYSSGGLTIDNGILLYNIDSLISTISVNTLTNMSGFSMGNVTYNSSAIAIDWEGLSFTRSTRVVLDVNAVPEPSVLALMGFGLLALFGVSRRRRQK